MGLLKKFRKLFICKPQAQQSSTEDDEEIGSISYCLSKDTSIHLVLEDKQHSDESDQIEQHPECSGLTSSYKEESSNHQGIENWCESGNKKQTNSHGTNYSSASTVIERPKIGVTGQEDIHRESSDQRRLENCHESRKKKQTENYDNKAIIRVYPYTIDFPIEEGVQQTPTRTTVKDNEDAIPKQEDRDKKNRNKQAARRYRQRKKAKAEDNQISLQTYLNRLKQDKDNKKKLIEQQEKAIRDFVPMYMKNVFNFENEQLAMHQIRAYIEKHLYDIKLGRNKDETEFAKKWILPELDKFVKEKSKKDEKEMKELQEFTSKWPDLAENIDEQFLNEIMYGEDRGIEYPDNELMTSWDIIDENDISCSSSENYFKLRLPFFKQQMF